MRSLIWGTPEELQKEWGPAGWIFGEKYRGAGSDPAEEIRALLPESAKAAEESEAKLELAKEPGKKFEKVDDPGPNGGSRGTEGASDSEKPYRRMGRGKIYSTRIR